MAWTTPSTVVAGQTLSAAFWNEQVRDNSDYLKGEADTLAAEQSFVFIKSQSFSSAASVSVTDVFSATYSSYEIVLKSFAGSTTAGASCRLRSGAGDETSSNYQFQQLISAGATTTSTRATVGDKWSAFSLYSNLNSGASYIRMVQPNAAQRTSYISLSLYQGGATAEMYYSAGDLATSTSYTGFTLLANSGTFSGVVSVYGIR